MPVLVLDFGERRPVLRPPRGMAARLRRALPPSWELRVVEAPADASGDGMAASREALEAVTDAEVYLGLGVDRRILEAGPALRWVHTGSAGVASSLTGGFPDDVVFTNSAGIHGPPIADTVLAMALHFARGLDVAVRGQAAGAWVKPTLDEGAVPLREFAGSVVGVVGYGGIGREVGRRAVALGARVLGLKRRPAPSEEGVAMVSGEDGLHRILAESHYVVLCAPETPETRGLIGARELAAMRPDAVLINVGRGALVDEAALVERLESGGIRGAGLDVFLREPLPPESPLWRLPTVLITPHTSSYSDRFWDRELALVEDNIGRWLAGRPLRNVVDTAAGY